MAKRSNGNDVMMAFRISAELKAMLERMAARRHTSLSEVMRQELQHAALRDALTAAPDSQVA